MSIKNNYLLRFTYSYNLSIKLILKRDHVWPTTRTRSQGATRIYFVLMNIYIHHQDGRQIRMIMKTQ